MVIYNRHPNKISLCSLPARSLHAFFTYSGMSNNIGNNVIMKAATNN